MSKSRGRGQEYSASICYRHLVNLLGIDSEMLRQLIYTGNIVFHYLPPCLTLPLMKDALKNDFKAPRVVRK